MLGALLGVGVGALAVSTWVPRPAVFEVSLGPWPLWRHPTDGVALTFDDGPDPSFTPPLLDRLADWGAKATFFMVAARARSHAALVRRARAEGHVIGCHGMTHRALAFLPRAELCREVHDAARILEDIVGEPVWLFRPPYGVRSPLLYRWLRREGLRPVFWSVMAYDWRTRSPDLVARRVIRGASPGAIVLLHDGGGDRSATVEAIPLVREGLEGRRLAWARLAFDAGSENGAARRRSA